MLRSTNLRRFAAGVAILGLMAGFSIPAAANVVIDGNLADFPTLNPDVCGTNATGDNIHQQGEKADDTNWALPAIQSPNTGDDFCGIGATTEIHGNDVFAVAGFQLYTCEPAATVVSFEMNSSTARTATNQPIRTVGDLWIDVIVNTLIRLRCTSIAGAARSGPRSRHRPESSRPSLPLQRVPAKSR